MKQDGGTLMDEMYYLVNRVAAYINKVAAGRNALASSHFIPDEGQIIQGDQPMPRSADDSSGVPQTRQITAEQSPQVSGLVTSRAQLGQ
jgi:hypothetical protein